jgi:hypothetical protein
MTETKGRGESSAVHGLQKVSHDLRHVIPVERWEAVCMGNDVPGDDAGAWRNDKEWQEIDSK